MALIMYGVRPRGDMTLNQAWMGNGGTCRHAGKGGPQVEIPQEGHLMRGTGTEYPVVVLKSL